MCVPLTIDNLKKIKLAITIGATRKEAQTTPEDEEYVFIYGIGTAGISPFEKALYNKKSGDTVLLKIYRKDLCETFVHLDPPRIGTFFSRDFFYIGIVIMEISDPSPTEIVKAMAIAGKCSGSGCDCCGN